MGLIVLAAAVLVFAARHAEPYLRTLIVDRLSERFHARVELGSFKVSVRNGLRAEGGNLRIWPASEAEGMAVAGANNSSKPLIELKSFRFQAPIRFSHGRPIRIDRIEIAGLAVDVPPRPRFTHTPEAHPAKPAGPPGAQLFQFLVGSVVCSGAQLTIENSNPAKEALVFDIRTVRVTDISMDGTMRYDAVLTNPRPKGLIMAHGSMGPWLTTDPGETPLAGEYKFDHADLGVFRGISGILNSTGRFSGRLRDLTVDGVTDTPDFALQRFDSPQTLHTEFHAHVDGTNGDTWLDPVNATLGRSHFTARGKVVQVVVPATAELPAHSIGHETSLDVQINEGQMADFLRLTSRSGDPLLTGTLRLHTTFDLPPGPDPVPERILLAGNFHLYDARFTNAKIQDRVAELSLRSQGKPKEAKAHDTGNGIRSTMAGDFTMDKGRISLPNLVYQVPGAKILLHGSYGVEGGTLGFAGTARMEATVSEMIGGWKGFLLKPIDRFFEKDGAGTKIGLRIGGTRDNPDFGVGPF